MIWKKRGLCFNMYLHMLSNWWSFCLYSVNPSFEIKQICTQNISVCGPFFLKERKKTQHLCFYDYIKLLNLKYDILSGNGYSIMGRPNLLHEVNDIIFCNNTFCLNQIEKKFLSHLLTRMPNR